MADVTVNRARLKDLMLRRNVGDKEMAHLTGLSRTTFYYLRTGHHETTSERNLTAIAQALDTTVDYLSGEGEPDVESDRVPVLLTESVRRLAEVASDLSEIRKEELIRIAETLLTMEREHNQLPPTVEVQDALIKIYNELKVFAGGDDPIETLQQILRANSDSSPPAMKPGKGIGNHLQKH